MDVAIVKLVVMLDSASLFVSNDFELVYQPVHRPSHLGPHLQLQKFKALDLKLPLLTTITFTDASTIYYSDRGFGALKA